MPKCTSWKAGWVACLVMVLGACSDETTPGETTSTPPDGGTGGGSDGGTDGGTIPDAGTEWALGLAIQPHQVRDGVVGVPYRQALSCVGCGSSVTWTVAAGALPSGLELTGADTPTATLEGTPTTAGSSSFAIQVTTAASESATRSYAVVVVAAERAIYADAQLTADSCADYEPASRACGAGGGRAYRTLLGAATAATAGDAVLLRAGTFAETLAPAVSGTAEAPIWYLAYGSESPEIRGAELEPGIELSDRQYLVLQGLTVSNVRRWLYARRAHHNVVRQATFTAALDSGGSSKTGLFFEEATFNQVVDCTIEDSTQDNLSLVKSDQNLVEGNTIRKAVHTLWTIKCGNQNVIRENAFHNELEKIGEIFDCDAVGFDHQFTLLDATKRNVVEGNVFAYTPSSGDSSPYAGIQYAGQQGIVRRNLFYDTVGPGLDLTLYSEEARYTTHNRVFHNVFTHTSFAGVSLSVPGADTSFVDNVLKNNVMSASVFVANDTRWSWYTDELAGKPVQVLVQGLEGYLFERNDILGTAAAQPYAVTHGQRSSDTNPEQHELGWWESSHPELFVGNLELEPGFVDETARDLRLTADSGLIDQGVFLTQAVGAGSGTALPVADAGYFMDGFGIPGVAGDSIQLESQTEPALVVAVDYDGNVLTLQEPLTWTDGQGVALRYTGQAPDVGAFER